MNAVGIVSIALGIVVTSVRGLQLVATAPTLRWFKRMVESNSQIRALGAFMVILAGSMIWAGASEDSGLATILTVLGWAMVVVGAPMLVVFPGVYRAVANAVLPSDTSGSLLLWRFAGLVGVAVGVALVYLGALAL